MVKWLSHTVLEVHLLVSCGAGDVYMIRYEAMGPHFRWLQYPLPFVPQAVVVAVSPHRVIGCTCGAATAGDPSALHEASLWLPSTLLCSQTHTVDWLLPAGCKQCKHPGNRINRIAKHSQRNPCRCCPPDFVSEHHTCQARPDMPCQCDFHTKETLRLVDKVCSAFHAPEEMAALHPY